jgi:3-oxoacyl-[acyl-carrier protein] reductase
MAIQLRDKVCLITGCGEGVGLGLVHGFLKRGAKVAAGIRNFAKTAEAVEPAFKVQLDVTRRDETRSAVESVIEKFGRIDVLINNAGIYPRMPVEEMDYDEFRRILDTNLDGAFRCSEAVIPHMIRQKSGGIINVGSITLRLGMAHLVHYTASKGGLVGMTRGMARDLGGFGIRVNCVHLGAVRTEGELRLFPDQEAITKDLNAKQSLPGRLTPESVEPVFAFLASEDSVDITGQCITADRGWTHD